MPTRPARRRQRAASRKGKKEKAFAGPQPTEVVVESNPELDAAVKNILSMVFSEAANINCLDYRNTTHYQVAVFVCSMFLYINGKTECDTSKFFRDVVSIFCHPEKRQEFDCILTSLKKDAEESVVTIEHYEYEDLLRYFWVLAIRYNLYESPGDPLPVWYVELQNNLLIIFDRCSDVSDFFGVSEVDSSSFGGDEVRTTVGLHSFQVIYEYFLNKLFGFEGEEIADGAEKYEYLSFVIPAATFVLEPKNVFSLLPLEFNTYYFIHEYFVKQLSVFYIFASHIVLCRKRGVFGEEESSPEDLVKLQIKVKFINNVIQCLMFIVPCCLAYIAHNAQSFMISSMTLVVFSLTGLILIPSVMPLRYGLERLIEDSINPSRLAGQIQAILDRMVIEEFPISFPRRHMPTWNVAIPPDEESCAERDDKRHKSSDNSTTHQEPNLIESGSTSLSKQKKQKLRIRRKSSSKHIGRTAFFPCVSTNSEIHEVAMWNHEGVVYVYGRQAINNECQVYLFHHPNGGYQGAFFVARPPGFQDDLNHRRVFDAVRRILVGGKFCPGAGGQGMVRPFTGLIKMKFLGELGDNRLLGFEVVPDFLSGHPTRRKKHFYLLCSKIMTHRDVEQVDQNSLSTMKACMFKKIRQWVADKAETEAKEEVEGAAAASVSK